MTKDVIRVEGLSKRFFRSRVDHPRTFQELFTTGFGKSLKQDEFWALRDVNFHLEAGKMMGVIGRNGAGKSTLLRLVGGVGKADQGLVVTNGRIGALIDLGIGFHPDLTGRENVYINGVISGLTRNEVADQFASIVDFAELNDFIDSPLRIYSLGMQMRLAFSVAIHIQPAILLIDEVLAVGDLSFQNKCLEKIKEFKAQGCAILLISHDANLVSKLCDESLWLEEGKVVAHGNASEVVNQYLKYMETETRRRTPDHHPNEQNHVDQNLKLKENRFGSLEMEIKKVNFFDQNGQEIRVLENGDPLDISIEFFASKIIHQPIFGVTITRDDGLLCWESSSQPGDIPVIQKKETGRVVLSIERLDLAAGHYFVDVGIYQHEWNYSYDYHWHAYTLEIHSPVQQKGLLQPPNLWKIE